MKVTILVGDLSEKGAGRWGRAVRPFLLTQALQQLGHQVEILGFSAPLNANLPITPELSIQQFYKSNYPQFLQAARQLIKSISGDIIYAYKLKPSSFGVGLVARSIKHLPLILDIDDWEMSWCGGDEWKYRPQAKQFLRDLIKPNGALREPDNRIYLKWIEQSVHKANHITVHTSFLQNRFGGTYIPNGKDTQLFNPHQYSSEDNRRLYGLDNYRVLMFPGAPRPYKGVEDVLEALDYINEPDLKLVIVGGSPYDTYDQTLLEKWQNRIIQIPKMPYQEMPNLISAADAIVVPQRDVPAAQAQFPLKLTDGMAMAKPIIATQVGDIPKILGDCGYLVESGNPQVMASTIKLVFDNLAEARQLGQAARQRCENQYSIQAMAKILGQEVLPQCQ